MKAGQNRALLGNGGPSLASLAKDAPLQAGRGATDDLSRLLGKKVTQKTGSGAAARPGGLAGSLNRKLGTAQTRRGTLATAAASGGLNTLDAILRKAGIGSSTEAPAPQNEAPADPGAGGGVPPGLGGAPAFVLAGMPMGENPLSPSAVQRAIADAYLANNGAGGAQVIAAY